MQKTQIRVDKTDSGKYEVRGQYVEDASPFLLDASIARAKEEQLRQVKGNEYKRVASIPFTLAMRIKAEDGVDPLHLKTPQDTRRYLKVLQTKYPQFLTTNKKVHRAARTSFGQSEPLKVTKPGRGYFRIPSECMKPDL